MPKNNMKYKRIWKKENKNIIEDDDIKADENIIRWKKIYEKSSRSDNKKQDNI